MGSLQIGLEKALDLIKGDNLQIIVQIRMHRAGDDEQFLILRVLVSLHHMGVSVPAHVAGVGLLSVDDKDSVADLIGVLEDGLIQEGHGADGVPALVGVERAGVVGPALVVLAVILHIEGNVLRHRQGQTAAGAAIVTATVDGGSGGAVSFPGLMAGRLAVRLVKVALGGDAAHVVHGGDHGGLDAGVDGRRVQGQAAPAADTQDADALRVHIVLDGEEVHRRLEVLGVDVRGGGVPGLAAALTGEGGVEGDGEEAPLRQRLGVEAGALLLHRPKGSTHGDGRQLSRGVFRRILVRRQGDAIAVDEGDFLVIHAVALGKGLVPLLR